MKAGISPYSSQKTAPAEEAPTQEIETLVLEALGQGGPAREPGMLRDFHKVVVPRLALPDTSLGILKAFANIDVTSEKVARCLKANPYYEFQFQKVIQSMGKREQPPSLEAAVVLLGMQNSRNLIVALQILRGARGTHPEWGKDGRLAIQPKQVVKYALKTEELLLARKAEYVDTGYAAGLVFDILAILAEDLAGDKKKALSYIDTIYNHGIRCASIGSAVGKYVPELSHRKYVFAAGLLHDIGKAVMAILHPAYLEFAEDSQKRELPRAVRVFVEEKRFGASHMAMGYLAVHALRMFKPIEKAMLYHHDPYLLRGRDRGSYQLASLVCLATRVASNFKKTEKVDDPVIATWKGPELEGFKIDTKTLLGAIAKVSI